MHALPREGRGQAASVHRRYATLITAVAVFTERLRSPRKPMSRGKAQRRARFAHESRFDRADVPVDELDDAALVNRGVWAGLISRGMDPARVLLDDPAILVVGLCPHVRELLTSPSTASLWTSHFVVTAVWFAPIGSTRKVTAWSMSTWLQVVG